MRKVEYFNYPKVVKKMHLADVVLKRIEKEVKKEFPSDRMMYELHVLRAVRSEYWQKPLQNQNKKR